MEEQSKNIDFIDLFYKFSMIIIAMSNLFYARYIYNAKDKKEDNEKKKDRKINWLKNLVLDYNLEHFYTTFDEIGVELLKLKESNDVVNIEDINNILAVKFIFLRTKFIDLLLAVDEDMYNDVLFKIDSLQDFLTEELFNEQNDFKNVETYDEILVQPLSEIKTNVLKIFFSYNG